VQPGFVLAVLVGAALLAGPAAGRAAPVTPERPTRLLVAPVAGEAASPHALHAAQALVTALAAADGVDVEARSAIETAGLPGAQRARELALAHGADALLASEPTGDTLHLELRSGHSGGLIGRWDLPAARAVDASALAPVLGALRAVLGSGAPEARAAVASGPPPATGPAGEAPIPLGTLRSDAPLEIVSEQLDVISHAGRRHLVFRRAVKVVQGDITLRTEKLDAYYPEGASQPERLVASGGVRVEQGERRARCDGATYDADARLIVCAGHAQLEQGCDLVRGERIEFDLEREHFRVVGAASVVLGREGEICRPGAAGSAS